ncbi:MAG: M23 family metallopeptidase [Patescibacteria group bacterium]
MHYPVDQKYKVTYDFGEINDDIYYVFGGGHPGLDFEMPVGKSIYATLPGWVYRVDFHRGMGKTIGIRYGNIQHMYAHLDKFKVEYGEWVEEGQKIALSGATCTATKPHLHFEIRDRSKALLKDRPLKPDFTKKIPNEFKEKFTITTTGKEALVDLSVKFFGSEGGITSLKKANPNLNSIKDNYVDRRKPLNSDIEIVIPT